MNDGEEWERAVLLQGLQAAGLEVEKNILVEAGGQQQVPATCLGNCKMKNGVAGCWRIVCVVVLIRLVLVEGCGAESGLWWSWFVLF